MSFAKNVLNNKLRKIVLLEFAIGFPVPINQWFKYEPGIWCFKYSNTAAGFSLNYSAGTGPAGAFPAGSSGIIESPVLRQSVNVNSFLAEFDQYTEVLTLASLRITNESYLWDYDTQLIYVHFDNYKTPYNFTSCTMGIVSGVCRNTDVNEHYYNGQYYEGRLNRIPAISKKSDPLFFGVSSYGNMRFSIDNTDGAFDNFDNFDIYGQKVQLKIGTELEAYEEFEIRYTGYLKTYDLSGDNIFFNVEDDTSRFKRKIGINTYNSDDYTYIAEDHYGKSIPLGYGSNIRKQTAICINEDESGPLNYEFKFVDTTYHDIYSINQVFVDNKKVTHINPDLTAGTFQLSTSNFEPGQEVTISYSGFVDGAGAIIEHPLDIIVDLLSTYQGIEFTSDFYNISSWEAIRSGITEKACYSTGTNQQTIENVITAMGSVAYGFFDILPDGKYDYKKSNRYQDSIANIRFYHLLEKPKRKVSGKEYLSSSKVGYNPSFNDNQRYKYIFNRDSENSIQKKHRKYREKEFKTFICSESKTADRAALLVLDYGGIFPNYILLCPYELYFLDILNNVHSEIIVQDIESYQFGIIKLEILEKKENLDNWTIEFKGRFIQNENELVNELYTATDKIPDELFTAKETGTLYTATD